MKKVGRTWKELGERENIIKIYYMKIFNKKAKRTSPWKQLIQNADQQADITQKGRRVVNATSLFILMYT